ncbi:unnamed protein product [Rotaria sordida]|uniref:SH2 domain-containing protein n=1 Tax=Rotaria sordida TaxID=392033 RepID=A0A818ZPS6_9BILA|nr:unnamed protein product [Rotaria sordida]CAF0820095.1 unnamed protein product [Rotaria sordida]CAF3775497.1 unnamed protein product [Rotaria sordida]CAF4045755.1 unnamed protein product [Rotaria sordida]
MFETIRRTFASSNTSQRMKSKSAHTIVGAATPADSNEETDSSLSDDFKSIQNSIVSINRPSSIILKSFAPNPSPLPSSPSVHDENTPWLHENITREAVEDALSCRSIGSFLVRRPTSITSTNTYVLSIRVPKYMKRSCVVHYLIDQDSDGYRLRGTKKVFPTLNSFIVHHSIVAENLPVVLNLRAYTSLHTMEDDDFNGKVARNEYVI